MSEKDQPASISIVVPVYNEAAGLAKFNDSLVDVLKRNHISNFEIIYCDDGSQDNTAELIRSWNVKNPRFKLLSLSRNFGKESALTAGISLAKGEVIVTIDGDGQHPVELLPEFIVEWQKGSKVVVGIRLTNDGAGWFKTWGSKLFYNLFNHLTGQRLEPGSSDYRLIDQTVRHEFLKLKESDRITRGLIDWLGFNRSYIYFHAKVREAGEVGYGKRQLIKLATNTFVSLSPKPLYMFGYLGVIITGLSLIVGLAVLFEQVLLGDPLAWKFTGTAMLSIMLLFLIGIVLMSQGILSLYVSNIQAQSKRRPLFVIDYDKSAGYKNNDVN